MDGPFTYIGRVTTMISQKHGFLDWDSNPRSRMYAVHSKKSLIEVLADKSTPTY
jgi:hypothetical protein